MAEDLEQEMRKSLEDLLRLYNIELDPEATKPEIETGEVDYAEVILKTQKKIDELNQQAEKIYQDTGMSKEEIEAYSLNPNNFTKEQWDILENVRRECNAFKEKAYAMMPKEDLAAMNKQAEFAVKKKKRVGKKKDWLQM